MKYSLFFELLEILAFFKITYILFTYFSPYLVYIKTTKISYI
jgi:hypothetical protein